MIGGGVAAFVLLAAGVMFFRPGSAPASPPAEAQAAAPPLGATAPSDQVLPGATTDVPPADGSAAAPESTSAASAGAAATAPAPKPVAQASAPAARTAASAPSRAAAASAPAATAAAGRKPDPVIEELRVARAKYDAGLYDQAAADLQALLDRHATSASAPDAHLLLANIHERLNRADDAAAGYVEVRARYPTSAAAPEATFAMAELTLRSRRADRERVARGLFGEVAVAYPDSPRAPLALARKATLEEQGRINVVDPELSASVPAALVSYRTLVERYPDSAQAQAAFVKLAETYEDLRRYELAAQTFDALTQRYPGNPHDAAWRAGEIYERRLKDMDAARAAYARVPPASSRYKDAQRRAQP
jgi:TolA-binding protein